MNQRAKKKSRTGASKLKSGRRTKSKSPRKRATSMRKASRRVPKKTVIAKTRRKRATSAPTRIVRIMGHGQFTIDTKALKKLNELDNAIVELVSTERSDDVEFKKKLTELNQIVVKDGKPLNPHEIIKSDIILPSSDLSIDEAKKLFKGEGVIPEI
jgi:PspAA-like protein